ncbi:hypothetical protein EDD11_005464 [Mortierella claussenii]|nr:hypothetical protein EDD11_005464 [Mortierella claussenii]
MSAISKKRTSSGKWPNNGEGSSSSSKRVRFGGDRDREGSGSMDEIDDSDLLEQRKTRRGGVTVVEYDEGGESSDDEEANKKKKKTLVDKIPGPEDRDGAEDEEEDMFADPDEIERRKAEKKTKAALKDKGKSKAFNKSEIEGEELNLDDLDEAEYDSDGNPKIEAFNMKEELEEGGEIDESGNFIRKLDPERFHDSWLEGVSRKEIQAAQQAHERKLRQAQDAEKEEAAKAMSKTDIYVELVNVLRPSETVIMALQRLGGGKKGGPKGSKGNKKKPWQKNKGMEEDPPEGSSFPESDEEAKRRELIEKLTDLSDRMMAMGHFDIYEETYEQAVRALRRADIIPDDWVIGTRVLKPGEQAEAILEDDPLFSSNPASWEYKWVNPPEGQSTDEVFGPFSGPDMKSWNDQGFFSQGILVRKVGDSTFAPGSSVSFE